MRSLKALRIWCRHSQLGLFVKKQQVLLQNIHLCRSLSFILIYLLYIHSYLNALNTILLINISLNVLLLPGWGDHAFDKKTMSCLFDRTYSYSYAVFVSIVGITTPIVVISVCYLKVIVLHITSLDHVISIFFTAFWWMI